MKIERWRYAEDFGNCPNRMRALSGWFRPDTAIKWKYGEDKEKKFQENDHSFIRRTYEKYKDLVKQMCGLVWIQVIMANNQKKW